MTEPYRKIWLQVEPGGERPEHADLWDLAETTWCQHRLNDGDIEYIRADLIKPMFSREQALEIERLEAIIVAKDQRIAELEAQINREKYRVRANRARKR
ncbi:MAG: hypothetical protein OES46_11220 [Gammaproteobacteria bacterium]|nr:hypothetical protein [Gammaproteobacteria bacterium]